MNETVAMNKASAENSSAGMSTHLQCEKVESLFAFAIESLNISNPRLIKIHEGGRFGKRVYAAGDRLYKIHIKSLNPTKGRSRQDYRGEYVVAQRCKGILGVAQVEDFIINGDIEAVVYQFIDGQPFEKLRISTWKRVCLLLFVFFAAIRMSLRGVAHNDLGMHNLLLGTDGRIWIIDFDQATIEPIAKALLINLVRRKNSGHPSDNTLGKSISSIIRFALRKK